MRLRVAVLLLTVFLSVACGKAAPTEPDLGSGSSDHPIPSPTGVAATPVERPAPTPTPEGRPCHPMPKCLED